MKPAPRRQGRGRFFCVQAACKGSPLRGAPAQRVRGGPCGTNLPLSHPSVGFAASSPPGEPLVAQPASVGADACIRPRVDVSIDPYRDVSPRRGGFHIRPLETLAKSQNRIQENKRKQENLQVFTSVTRINKNSSPKPLTLPPVSAIITLARKSAAKALLNTVTRRTC